VEKQVEVEASKQASVGSKDERHNDGRILPLVQCQKQPRPLSSSPLILKQTVAKVMNRPVSNSNNTIAKLGQPRLALYVAEDDAAS
jgi:hypothetical protein